MMTPSTTAAMMTGLAYRHERSNMLLIIDSSRVCASAMFSNTASSYLSKGGHGLRQPSELSARPR